MSKLTRIKRKQATRQDRNLKNTLFTDPKKRRRARMKRLITKKDRLRLATVQALADEIKLFNDKTPLKKPRQWVDNVQLKIDNLLGGRAELYAIATTPRVAVFGIRTDRRKFEDWIKPIVDEINRAGAQPVATYGWYETQKDAAWVEGQPVEYIILIASLNVFKFGLPQHLIKGHVMFFLKKGPFEQADPNSLSDAEVLGIFQKQIQEQVTAHMPVPPKPEEEEKPFDPFNPDAEW